jgi:copper(I)-binding protein
MKCTSLVVGAFLMLGTSGAFAQSYKSGSIVVEHPWVRATPKGADSTAGYFRITNSGASADRLIGVSSPVASRVEIHEMSMTGGVMSMRPLPNGLEIKPGETVELKPSSSFHAMFVGLKQPLKQGDHVKGTLTFENAGSVDVDYMVESLGAKQPASPGMGKMQMH